MKLGWLLHVGALLGIVVIISGIYQVYLLDSTMAIGVIKITGGLLVLALMQFIRKNKLKNYLEEYR